jgi:hypothetical protein
MRSPTAFLLLALLLLAAPAMSAETVSHPQLGFSMSAPEGFVPTPERVQGKVIYAFDRPPVDQQKASVAILVSRLGGTIPHKRLDPKAVAAKNPLVTVTTEQWKGFDIDVFRVPEEVEGIRLVTFNAQVPLKREAIQVAVVGEADREEEVRSNLRSVLASLEGESNWVQDERNQPNTPAERDTSAERSRRLADRITAGILGVGTLVGVAVVIWQVLRKPKQPVRKRKPPVD